MLCYNAIKKFYFQEIFQHICDSCLRCCYLCCCCCRFWQLDIDKVGRKGQSQKDTWDLAVYDASEEYKTRMVFPKYLSYY